MAKRALAVSVYNHYKRIHTPAKKDDEALEERVEAAIPLSVVLGRVERAHLLLAKLRPRRHEAARGAAGEGEASVDVEERTHLPAAEAAGRGGPGLHPR